jgi:hypothetical protein
MRESYTAQPMSMFVTGYTCMEIIHCMETGFGDPLCGIKKLTRAVKSWVCLNVFNIYFFVCSLFNEGVSNADYLASNNWIIMNIRYCPCFFLQRMGKSMKIPSQDS